MNILQYNVTSESENKLLSVLFDEYANNYYGWAFLRC